MNLACAEVDFGYGDDLVLRDLTLEVAAGQSLWIVGPAGSGKTTALKLLAGLLVPTRGAVRWDNADIATLPREQRHLLTQHIAMVFQNDALFDWLTVIENVTYPLLRRGVDAAEASRRALEALDTVALGEAAQRHPDQLSGGMRKRVGIARALVARPRALLADDPFAGLDPDTAHDIALALQRALSASTLIVAAAEPLGALPLERTVDMTAWSASRNQHEAR